MDVLETAARRVRLIAPALCCCIRRLEPRGALISQTAPAPQPRLAHLIYLPDMCFPVCFLLPLSRSRRYWAVSTALLHSRQTINHACALLQTRLVFSTSISAGSFRKRLVLFLPFIRKKIALSKVALPDTGAEWRRQMFVSFLESHYCIDCWIH